MAKKNKTAIHSSAAEYLTFIAASGDSQESFEVRYQHENIWLTQKMMATLYDVDIRTINEHISSIYADRELELESTIRNFRIVQTEGARQVSRETKHYNLQMIISVGFKVNSDRAVQFCKWAGWIVKDYTIQGWTMDVARLKNGHMGLATWDAAPDGKIIKADVSIAKNYLSEKEMSYLGRIVSLYLDYAESQAERKIPMSMADWGKRLDGFLEFNRNEILTGPGKISHEEAKLHAESEFEKYRITQNRLFMSDYDKYLLELEESMEEKVEIDKKPEAVR